MIAAIGTDGNRPVVWGLGRTQRSAEREADSMDGTWHSQGSACVEVSSTIAQRIMAGVVDCEILGIVVRCDRSGQIVSASVRPRGRQPRNVTAALCRIELRLTETERTRWRAAAERHGVSLSVWLRNAAETAAGNGLCYHDPEQRA